MRIRASHALALTMAWSLTLLAGCRFTQPSSPAVDTVAATTASEADEAQRIADAALGKQAEILDRGDLARNGREQLLVINRYSSEAKSGSAARITRAVVLEKSEGQWREILRCDEHLKNPYGYLVSSTAGGWELTFGNDSNATLELQFTPLDRFESTDGGGQHNGAANRTFVVRWNTKANRYQAYDRSQKRYLRETTALDIPESFLK